MVVPRSVEPLREAIQYYVVGSGGRRPLVPPVILLVAPQGSGKRTVVEHLASEAADRGGRGHPPIQYEYVTPDRVVSKWYGESTQRVAGVIDSVARGIIVFDDVEELFPARSTLKYEDEETRRMKAALSARLARLLDEEKPSKVVVFLANNDKVDPFIKSRSYILKMTYEEKEIIEVTKTILSKYGIQDLDPEEVYRIVRRGVLELDYQYVVPRDIETVLSYALRHANEEGRNVTIDDIRKYARRAKDYVEEEYSEVVQIIRPNVRLADVGGMHGIKEKIVKIVKYALAGGDVPRGILLYGPPGVGKTYLAKAIAAESEATFLYVRIRDILSSSDPVAAVSKVFRTARRYAPSIVFIDEFDAVAGRRELNPNPYLSSVVNQLLTELEGLTAGNSGVVLIAATNFIEKIDEAVISRFAPNIFPVLPPRTLEEYREIVEVYIRRYNADFSADDVLDILLARFRTPRAIARIFEEANRLRGFELYAYRSRDPVFAGDLERAERIAEKYCGGDLDECVARGYPLRVEHLLEAVEMVPSETKKIMEFYKRYIGPGKRTGFALGVAVLSAGSGVEEGGILPILVNKAPGHGEITVIGGDETVSDSARAALAWLASEHPEALEYDWYVHFVSPLEGAVDPATGRKIGVSGPSAGAAIAVALYSALTGKPVPTDTAYSGKISVHGDIGEVGGWDPNSSGKAFAVMVAKSFGLRRVFIPAVVAKDNPIVEVMRRHVEVVTVDSVKEIISRVFG